MSDLISNLVVSVPAAIAVIVVVMLFLKHLREERESRDTTQVRFIKSLQDLARPIGEMSKELSLLRELVKTQLEQ